MSDIVCALGQSIRALRYERQMSQEELAFKAGISAAHLGQIERATKNPTVDTVAKIAAALNVPVTNLFSEAPAADLQHSAIVGKINAHLTGMTGDEQRDILRIIRIMQNQKRRNGRG